MLVFTCTSRFMGLTVRSREFRYTEWFRWDGEKERPKWHAGLVARELYDHRGDDGSDFDAFENENVASDISFNQTVKELSMYVRAHWNETASPSLLCTQPNETEVTVQLPETTLQLSKAEIHEA